MIKYNSFFLSILIIYFSISSFCLKKDKLKKTIKPVDDKFEIDSILSWAKDNNIYINEHIILNKNTNSSHNFFYFTSNSSIENNTVLLRVPYNIMISKDNLIEHFNKTKNKKIFDLWKQIVSLKTESISNYATKQFLFMAIIIEKSINKKKGSLFKKYEPYFNMYEYINMDIFPIFFDEDEIYFLSPSGFGAELIKAKEYLDDEYLTTKNKLGMSSSMPDTFLKYRVLTLANSLRFNNTNIKKEYNTTEYNDTVIVPFIDCFKKKIKDNNSIMADYFFEKDEKGNYYLEIRTIKDIKIGEEITLQWRRLSNQDSFLFYGFIDEDNLLLPKMYVNVLNNMMKKDLGFDENKDFGFVANRDLYELNSEFIESDIVYSYKNISEHVDKYKNKKEGRYEMMRDNLNYYLRIYEEQLTDGNINIYIRGNNKKRIIKFLMKMEKEVFKSKINYVEMLIKDIKENNFKLDDL